MALRKIAFTFAGIFTISAAIAQNIPKPAITGTDAHDYVCTVRSINEDNTARSLYGRTINFWIKTMTTGKFVALSPTQVRVAAASPERAGAELFDFYQKYSSLVRGDEMEKGQRPYASVVLGCVDDPRSTRAIKVASVPLGNYKLLLNEHDHFNLFLALYKGKITDEQLVKMENGWVKFPTDVFERQEFIQQNATRIKKSIALEKVTPIILQSSRPFPAYSFEKAGFDLGDVVGKSDEYDFQYKGRQEVKLPRYNLSGSPKLSFYKPANQDEAKKLERMRVAEGTFLWKAYVQPISAVMTDKDIEVNGVISTIEVLNKKGEVVMRMTSN